LDRVLKESVAAIMLYLGDWVVHCATLPPPKTALVDPHS